MGKISKIKGGLVIDRPGHVMFIPVNADGTLDYANAIRSTAAINTITVTNSKTKTEIPDGNNFYPAGDRVTAIAGTVAIEFSTIDLAIWAMCSGNELVSTNNDTMLKIYDYDKIGEDNIIELPDQYKIDGFVQVIGSDGTVYEKVTGDSAPSAGEFKIAYADNKTTLTFAAADANKDVAISMMVVTKTTSYSQGRKAMKYHKIIIHTEYSTVNDAEKVSANIIVSQASVSGDMVDALQKDPSATKTLTFNMYAPLPGEEPYQVKLEDKME